MEESTTDLTTIVKGIPTVTKKYSIDNLKEVKIPKAWFENPNSMLDSMGMGFKEHPSQLTYETLHNMAKKNHIVGIVHKTIKSLVVSFCRRPKNKWDVGFKIKHRYLKDWELKPKHKKQIEEITQWFEYCGSDYHPERPGLKRFVEMVLDDRLIYAQMSAELITRRDGKLHSMWYVPAMSIRLASPKMRHQHGASTVEQINNAPKYFQVHNNMVLTAWKEKDFVWEVVNPRNTLWGGYGYGTSELEQLIVAITAELWSEEYNINNFKNGSSIKGVFNIKGNMGREEMDDLRRNWMMQLSGVHNAFRQLFINSEKLDFIPLDLTNSEMGFETWIRFLIDVICLMYQIHPSICGFPASNGAATARMPRSVELLESVTKSQNKFLRPFLHMLEDIFNGPKIMGRINPEYYFEWQGVDKKDEEKDIENRNKELQFFKTVNEHRREDGLEEKEGWDIPLNAVLTGYLSQQKVIDLQQEQFQFTKEQAAREAEMVAQKQQQLQGSPEEGSVAEIPSTEEEPAPNAAPSTSSQAKMFADSNQQGSSVQQTQKSINAIVLTEQDVNLLVKSGEYDVI